VYAKCGYDISLTAVYNTVILWFDQISSWILKMEMFDMVHANYGCHEFAVSQCPSISVADVYQL
jgi:hypothetical protein